MNLSKLQLFFGVQKIPDGSQWSTCSSTFLEPGCVCSSNNVFQEKSLERLNRVRLRETAASEKALLENLPAAHQADSSLHSAEVPPQRLCWGPFAEVAVRVHLCPAKDSGYMQQVLDEVALSSALVNYANVTDERNTGSFLVSSAWACIIPFVHLMPQQQEHRNCGWLLQFSDQSVRSVRLQRVKGRTCHWRLQVQPHSNPPKPTPPDSGVHWSLILALWNEVSMWLKVK